MLKYVASMVAAVTIMISSAPVKAEEVKNETLVWAKQITQVRIDDGSKVTVSALTPRRAQYQLSLDEQAVLRRALMRSVRILS